MQFALTGISGRTWSVQSSGGNYGPGSQLNGSFQIVDRNSPASRLLIDSTGNVGIGTISTSQRLTVNGNILAAGTITPSSGRFKHHIAPISDALEKLSQLDGVRFAWKPQHAAERNGRVHDLGLAAEDVAKVFPEVVFTDADGKVTGMDYSRLTTVAVAAIKQQQAQRDADRARFEAQLARRDAERTQRDAQIAELKARLEALEAALKQVTDRN
jgi:hypothetical protein